MKHVGGVELYLLSILTSVSWQLDAPAASLPTRRVGS